MSENEMNTQNTAFEEPVLVKPKSKKGLFIGIAALVVVAIIAAVVVGVLANSPMGLIATGFSNSMKAMEDDAYTKLMNKVSNGGSMELAMDLATLMQGSDLPLSGTASVKVYMDSEKQKTVTSVGVLLGGIQNLDATIFADPESVVLASQWLLGEKAYGLDLKNLEESFKSSVFGPDGPFSLDLELPENFQEQLDKYQDYAKATEKIAKQLAARMVNTLEKNTNVTKENATLTLGGETVKTTAVIMEMDAVQVMAVLEDLLTYLRTDKDFRAYVEEYKEILFPSAANGVVDADTIVKGIFKVLDEAAEDLDELKQEMVEGEASLKAVFHITKSGKQLVGMEIFLLDKYNEKPITISLVAGPDLANVKEVTFRVEDGEETIQGTYNVKVNDENTLFALLDIRENDRDVLKADVRWDKQTGAWEFTVTSEQDNSIIVRGTQEYSDEKLSVVLESVEAEGEKVNLGLSMVLRASDKMPAAPEYTDILKMTEAEVTNFINDLSMLFFQMAFA